MDRTSFLNTVQPKFVQESIIKMTIRKNDIL
mgnify:FL=1